MDELGDLQTDRTNICFFFYILLIWKLRARVGPGVSLTLCCFVVYSPRRFAVCLSVCHFVLVFFSPFSIAITSLGEERANLSAFRTFVRFVLVWICRFPLPLGVWEGLRFVIVALPGLFSYLFFGSCKASLSSPPPHTHTHTHTHTRAPLTNLLLTVPRRYFHCGTFC